MHRLIFSVCLCLSLSASAYEQVTVKCESCPTGWKFVKLKNKNKIP